MLTLRRLNHPARWGGRACRGTVLVTDLARGLAVFAVSIVRAAILIRRAAVGHGSLTRSEARDHLYRAVIAGEPSGHFAG